MTTVGGDKYKALYMATRIIDRLNYIGSKTETDQEHEFPRNGETTVPQDILDACCEIAISLLDGYNDDIEYENQFVQQQKYSNVQTTYNRPAASEHIIAGVPSIVAWRLLKPYLRDPNAVSLSRA